VRFTRVMHVLARCWISDGLAIGGDNARRWSSDGPAIGGNNLGMSILKCRRRVILRHACSLNKIDGILASL